MVSRTVDGIYLGVSIGTGESIVGDKGGIFKTRSIHRKPIEQRWSREEVLHMRGVPWKPYQHSDDDKLQTRIPTPAEEGEDKRKERSFADAAYKPRNFKIEKGDVIKYGQTPQCMGRHQQMMGLPHKTPTPVCRDRPSKLMMQDPIDCYRIANARQREYAYHGQQLGRTDMQRAKNTDDENEPQQT